MGLSTSTKKSTSTQQQSGTNAETATTTPNIFAPAVTPATNYYDLVGGIGAQIKADPYAYSNPANGLQMMGFENAGKLGGWQGTLANSSSLAARTADAGPNLATGIGYTAPQLADAVTFGGASAGPAAQATAQGYNIANLGNAQGYNAPQLGPAAQAQSASLLDNFAAYADPVTGELVDKNLAVFDDGGARARNAMELQAAKNKSFGGSGYAIQQATFDADTARNRGLLSAQLRSNAFDKQAGLASSDADRRQNTSMFNVGQQNNMAVAQGGFDADAARFGADANNQFALNRFGAQNAANQFGANANNTASMFNAGEQNQNARTDASNQTQAGIASMNAQNQRNQYEAQLLAQQGMFNADAFNNLSMFNAGQGDNALARQLSAAGLLSNNAGLFGSQQRDDVASQLNAGGQMWDIQNRLMQQPLTNAAAYSQLLNPGLIDTLSGQTINSNGQFQSYGTGTGTEKSSGGFLGGLGGLIGGIGGLASGLGGLGVKL